MSILLRALAAGLAVSAFSGCSSITQGTSQDIHITTSPPEASCVLLREGVEIGRVNTPGPVHVQKSKHDILITCDKEDYQTATYYNDSGWETGSGAAGIALDVFLTLGVSSAIDSATGADNKYESYVNLTLTPVPENAQAEAAAEQ